MAITTLLIDDGKDFLNSLSLKLEDKEYNVDIFGEGINAITSNLLKQPNFIL
mgnify:CR=1 FL=1|jgi:hypothetical protein|tara:strand:- start:754 stop:909 length:156 start_codon:yes stop_codon:yes gene_type:complete